MFYINFFGTVNFSFTETGPRTEEHSPFLTDSYTIIQPSNDGRSLYTYKTPVIGRNSICSTTSDIARNNNNSSLDIDIKIHSLFDQYKDNDVDSILLDGMEKFCVDLGLQPDDFKMLVLAWKFRADVMCQFTRNEFFQGCKVMNADSIEGILNKIPYIVDELNDPGQFKDFYKFTFKFGLDKSIGEKTLPVDTASALWRLVFSRDKPPFLDKWIDFLLLHKHIRGIPKDTWMMFLTFCSTVDPSLSNYDECEAWPSVFDDFVEAMKPKS